MNDQRVAARASLECEHLLDSRILARVGRQAIDGFRGHGDQVTGAQTGGAFVDIGCDKGHNGYEQGSNDHILSRIEHRDLPVGKVRVVTAPKNICDHFLLLNGNYWPPRANRIRLESAKSYTQLILTQPVFWAPSSGKVIQ